MKYDEAWAGYREYESKWKSAGIPWNQKGSPHRLLLKARWYLKQLPINEIVSRTMRYFAPQMAKNIQQNNALLKRLKRQ